MDFENTLNQELTNDGLFDDVVEDTPIETAESKEPVVAESNEPFLKIKYNKEELGLTKEEATELAQKGKNYDKVNEKYTSLNGQLEKLARMNGLEVSDYLSQLSDTQMRFETSKEIKELQAKYPNADKELLEEIAKSRVSERLSAKEKEAEALRVEKEDQSKKEIERQVNMFSKRYPNLDAANLNQSVYDLMENEGYTLLEAYTIWKESEQGKLDAEATKKAEIDNLNKRNKAKSLGNVTNAGTTAEDDFMAGFNSY